MSPFSTASKAWMGKAGKATKRAVSRGHWGTSSASQTSMSSAGVTGVSNADYSSTNTFAAPNGNTDYSRPTMSNFNTTFQHQNHTGPGTNNPNFMSGFKPSSKVADSSTVASTFASHQSSNVGSTPRTDKSTSISQAFRMGRLRLGEKLTGHDLSKHDKAWMRGTIDQATALIGRIDKKTYTRYYTPGTRLRESSMQSRTIDYQKILISALDTWAKRTKKGDFDFEAVTAHMNQGRDKVEEGYKQIMWAAGTQIRPQRTVANSVISDIPHFNDCFRLEPQLRGSE